MKKIDYDWLKRVCDVHDKMDRGVSLDSPATRCTKEILLDRYFKFLDNRAFKIRIPITDGKYATEEEMEYEIFYAWFHKSKHTTTHKNGEVYYSYGVRKHLSWNDHEFTISFRDEKLKYRSFTKHWNDILRITFEEIPIEEYWKVAELFIDTTPPISKSPNYNYCQHIDVAQGKYLCVSKDVKDRKCVGVECGSYTETR